MPHHFFQNRLGFGLGAFLIVALLATPAFPAEAGRVWQAIPARPYVLRGADRRLLDRAEQFLTDQQWDDALTALMQLNTVENDGVVPIAEDRFVSLPEYCQKLIAQLPKKTLSRYRQLVDTSSKTWYEQGIADRDERLLRRVADQNFCSSWGDDALWALGELALERGDYQAARNAWSRLVPRSAWLSYPDSDLPPAAVRARLVLVSLREGNWERAENELNEFAASHPTATGRMAGREVVFVEWLTRLLEQARRGEKEERVGYELLWSRPWGNEGLAMTPCIANGFVVYQDDNSVRALKLADGQPAFTARGKTFQSPRKNEGWLGRTWHALTADRQRVYGTTSQPIGPRRNQSGADMASLCWCLDLQRDGALAFQIVSDETGVAFVGAPRIHENRLFVALRANDQTARAGIACYDLSTRALQWQRWLCQSNTPATGWRNEVVANTLTLDAGIIYFNTNLGAVAALRADDGQIHWLRTYKRQADEIKPDGTCDYYAGPRPCVSYQGAVFVHPTDALELLAFDAETGETMRNANEPTNARAPSLPEQGNLTTVGDYAIVATAPEILAFQSKPRATVTKHSTKE